jgi:hypothetical protein
VLVEASELFTSYVQGQGTDRDERSERGAGKGGGEPRLAPTSAAGELAGGLAECCTPSECPLHPSRRTTTNSEELEGDLRFLISFIS